MVLSQYYSVFYVIMNKPPIDDPLHFAITLYSLQFTTHYYVCRKEQFLLSGYLCILKA